MPPQAVYGVRRFLAYFYRLVPTLSAKMCSRVTTFRAVTAFSLLCLVSTAAVNLTNTPSAYTLRKLFDEETCVHYNHSNRNRYLIDVLTIFHNGYGVEHPVTDDCKCLTVCWRVCAWRTLACIACTVVVLGADTRVWWARGATLFSTALHHDEVTDSQLMTIRACSLKLATAGRSSCTNYDMYNANVV